MLGPQVNGRCPRDLKWVNHRVHLPARCLGPNNVVRLEYTNAYDTDGAGLHTFTDPVDNETYIYTNLEPCVAWQWLWLCW